MDLDQQLKTVLRVPQSQDLDKMVRLACGESNYQRVSILNSLDQCSNQYIQPQHRFDPHKSSFALGTQHSAPPPPSRDKRERNTKRRRWNINTILGHVLLIVFHMVQWQKITQTRGVSSEEEFLDEELE